MPRSEKDNLEIRKTRREEILEAAKRVFAAKGFGAARIAEVASEAGLSHGLVYHYFASKDALLTAIVEQVVADLDEDARGDRDDESRAIDRLRGLIVRRRAWAEDACHPMRLVLQAALQDQLPQEAKTRLQTHFQRLAHRQREWLLEAQAEGDVDDSVDAGETVKVLSYLMRGMNIRVPGEGKAPLALPATETILQLLLPPPRQGTSVHRRDSSESISAPMRPPRKRP